MMEHAPDFGPDEYTISVRREWVDGEPSFVARIAEFPDVIVYEDSATGAYEALLMVVGDLVEQLRASGRSVPMPEAMPEEFSGRVTFRMPRSLHGRIDARAKAEGVSINTWLVAAAESYLSVPMERRSCSASARYSLLETTGPVWTVGTTAFDAAVVVMKSTIAAMNMHSESGVEAGDWGASSSTLNEDDDIHRHFVSVRTY
jgi:predicted HicB family RNase H-like nuclease